MAYAQTIPVSGTSIEFPRFPDLPTELRHKIWRAAMPRRVVHIYERPVLDTHELAHRKRHRRLEQLGVKTRSEPNEWMWKRPWDGYSDRGKPIGFEEEEYLQERGKETFFCESCNVFLPKARPPRPWGIGSDAEIPSIILACREAFEICKYAQSFAYRDEGTFAQTYFKPEVDTLFFSESSPSTLRDPTCRTTSAFDRLERMITALGTTQLETVRYVGLTVAGISSWALLERWLARVLCCFKNIRTLYLVIDDWPQWPIGVNNGKPWMFKHRAGVTLAAPINPNKVLEIFNNPDPKLADWYQLRSRMPPCGINPQRLQDLIDNQAESVSWAGGSFGVEARYVIYPNMAVKLARAQKEWRKRIQVAEEQEVLKYGIEAVCGELYEET
ncbi:uncharacterized protein PAC_01191 [Phialocephala subalpina]|uniref:2EXR domain-containing protein n=1 Tax=Phialocephala subalpina TaxID=576137 RepID=A0A1L7WEY9_9HELO|nr:uncharacterized protein PAC_01191 [Phialocephala subalpina]